MVGPGAVLAGKYQVERVLGQGGMGCVVSAIHLQLGQRVAIKYMLPDSLRVPEAVERFLREARAAVRLRSEHVGRVIDVGQLDDGAPYIVMEFLEGIDLAGHLRQQGRLPIAQAVDYVLQGCEAIAEAHQIGIVHRDLKPANLFLTRRTDGAPLIKVLDFGISKAAQGDQGFSITRTTTVMGSPGYMSPEQLRSAKDCDARTDIWALGIILYELTVGRPPFTAESITELAIKVALDPAPPMRLDPGFEAVVLHCLAKEVTHRFQNVAELAAALAPFGPAGAADAAARVARVMQIRPSTLITPPRFAMPQGTPSPSMSSAPTTLSGAAGVTNPRATTSRRTGLIAGLAGLVVVGGVAIALVLSTGTGTRARDSEAEVAPEPAAAPPPPDAAAVPANVAAPTLIDAGVTAPTVEPAPKKAERPRKPRKPRKPRGSATPSPEPDEDLTDSRY